MSDRERALPDILPIFPLTGVLLLPRGRLPLNIFEPRYLTMTKDALGGERLIGMVQPSEPELQDNRGRGAMNPPVYPVGCAGRITSFTEADDGRYMITLTGLSCGPIGSPSRATSTRRPAPNSTATALSAA